jgi:hypothetical protein
MKNKNEPPTPAIIRQFDKIFPILTGTGMTGGEFLK